DKEIFKVESEIIQKVANENPAVIIGRGGGYILRNRPNHISIYLHADIEFRARLIQEQYSLSAKAAGSYVETVDKSRTRYVHDITGCDMNDARQYDLSVDTGILGMEGAEKVIMAYLDARFGDVESINKGGE
ncbi:MAG: cytidylate kinase-like family protein, partial [Peptostreptococcaceae bacterium]|nr:cytidylate kinase-like family protein [Peptostreptococcaceae bacterium]